MRGFYHPQVGNPTDMGGMEHSTRRRDRDETRAERMDRLFGDLLQELRVMQTGAQLTSGFLLTLPFQSRFTILNDTEKAVYLVLVGLSLLTTAFVMSAVAVHQRLSGREVKDRVVLAGRRLLTGVLVTLSLLVVGIAFFVAEVVVGAGPAVGAGMAALVVLLILIVALPRWLLTRDDEDTAAER
jgi:hypothetical protein